MVRPEYKQLKLLFVFILLRSNLRSKIFVYALSCADDLKIPYTFVISSYFCSCGQRDGKFELRKDFASPTVYHLGVGFFLHIYYMVVSHKDRNY